jgi:molybdopterin/thiamine biosynthesis adenylyltransferase
MKMNIFSKSRIPEQHVLYRTKHLAGVEDRQQKLKGFNQEALATAKVILIGAGGLGSEIGEALVRKGVGTLVIFDHDSVELTNLNRQKFNKSDLDKPKAHRLALNLSKEGFLGTVIEGYSLCFEDALQQGVDLSCTLAIVGVDNNPCRVAASTYYREQAIPCIFTAVSLDVSHGYSFLQEPGKACFGCLFKDAITDETYPCPGTPAVKDILKVMGGIVSYAVDSLLLMERLRTYNYKSVYLCGTVPGNDWMVPRRPGCKLCDAGNALPQAEGTV